MRKIWLWVMLAVGVGVMQGQQAMVAPTPPMGWNSWDAYGLTITEEQFRANVNVLKTKLQPFGWQYAVIDEGWYFFNPDDRPTPDKLHYAVDTHGRYVPVPARFPSTMGRGGIGRPSAGKMQTTIEETSFKALGDYVHGQGLKFGIHIVRGIPRVSVERNLPIDGSEFKAQDAADTSDACGWDPTNWGVKDTPAGQAWYDSLLKQYADWGVDLLKVDCISDHPYKASEIRQIRKAIDKAGRPMVLSLSPGPTNLSHAQEVGELSNMWRISNDVWDLWAPAGRQSDGFPQNIRAQFGLLASWATYAKANNWPDADMLPLGQLRPSAGWGQPRASRLTLEEQRSLMTLWGIARSPLILGANLTLLDAPTLALLTNRDLIRVNQTATHSEQVLQDGDLIAWRADLPGGEKAVALFNLGDTEMNLTRQLAEFGKDLGGRDWAVRNIWGGGVAISGHEFVERVPPHGCVLLMLQ